VQGETRAEAVSHSENAVIGAGRPPIGLVIAILFGLSRPDIAFGQTPTPRVPASLTAHVPFDFWIGGTPLPAGDYSISPGVPSVVVFWNEAGHVGEQVFLVSTGASVVSGSCKLILSSTMANIISELFGIRRVKRPLLPNSTCL
jgi:hypothetical protein